MLTKEDPSTAHDHRYPSTSNEVDPGSKGYVDYAFALTTGGGGNYTAKVIAANGTYSYTSGGSTYTFQRKSEYWSFPTANYSSFQSPSAGSSMTITGSVSLDWPASGGVSGFPVSGGTYTAATGVSTNGLTWGPLSSSPSNVFYYTDLSSNPRNGFAISFANLSYNSSNNTWSGSLTWYQIGSAAPTTFIIGPSQNTTLTFGTPPTPASGLSWYMGTPLATVQFG